MGTNSEDIYSARVRRETLSRSDLRRQKKEAGKRTDESKRILLGEINKILPRAIAVLDAQEWVGAARIRENRYSVLGGRRGFYSSPAVLLFSTSCGCDQTCRCMNSTYYLGVDHKFYRSAFPVQLSGLSLEVLGSIRGALTRIAGDTREP